MNVIIGRKTEIEILKNSYHSGNPEFVIVYGRRRVGKTFLVRQTFENQFDFYVTGLFQKNKNRQLENFSNALAEYSGVDQETPKDWFSAFRQLKTYLQSLAKSRMLVFIDELPWMDTPKSDFVSALENFWNGWGSGESRLMLIICGSATSWMSKKILGGRGGLFNRDTRRIYLNPFNLAETEAFFQANQIELSRYDIIESYMIMGGIPYYLSKFNKGFSLSQNIDNLFFKKKSLLWDEFSHLYNALFNKSDLYIKVVEALSRKREGFNRQEISKMTGIPDGGNLSKILSDLFDSDFILANNYFGQKSRNTIYQLADFYTLFYYYFIKDNLSRDEHQWMNMIDSQKHRIWCGLAFEQVCMAHLPQIKKALGISGVQTECSAWRSKAAENRSGTQIDLLIDRKDGVINICEIKYAQSLFEIDKNYAENLHQKMSVFKETSLSSKALHLTMITTYGIKSNSYSNMVQQSITMDDLFQ